jgi:hypothetical protein
MNSVLQAYTQNLPGLMKVTSENTLPTEQNILNANKVLAPQQNQLALDLYNQFGKQFTQAGIDVNQMQQLGQAQTDLATLQGPGKQLAAAQLEAQKLADPEYYKAREAAMSQLGNLFSGLPDAKGGLSGAEREEVSRSVARDNFSRGNVDPTQIGTVENAMRFGAAGENRMAANQDRIAKAIGAATSFLPASKSGIDVLNTTTGRQTIANPGQSQFAGVSGNTGANTFGMGKDLLGATSAANLQENDINSKRRDALDRASQVMSSMPSVSCCWIFLTAHNGELPWYVRYARNVYGTDNVRRGYKRMSKWLVPLMNRSLIARYLVRMLMTDPLAMYAGYKLGVPECRNGWVFRPLRNFWWKIWNNLGREQ